MKENNIWWDFFLPEYLNINKFKFQGNYIKNIGKKLPVCKVCKSKTIWVPKIDGNIDVGFDLVYHCKNHDKARFKIINIT